MTDTQVLDIATSAMRVAAILGGPILIVALVIGVVISLMQTVTQIQEMTLTFVPKVIGIALVIIVAGNWMLRELVTYSAQLWGSIPTIFG